MAYLAVVWQGSKADCMLLCTQISPGHTASPSLLLCNGGMHEQAGFLTCDGRPSCCLEDGWSTHTVLYKFSCAAVSRIEFVQDSTQWALYKTPRELYQKGFLQASHL